MRFFAKFSGGDILRRGVKIVSEKLEIRQICAVVVPDVGLLRKFFAQTGMRHFDGRQASDRFPVKGVAENINSQVISFTGLLGKLKFNMKMILNQGNTLHLLQPEMGLLAELPPGFLGGMDGQMQPFDLFHK